MIILFSLIKNHGEETPIDRLIMSGVCLTAVIDFCSFEVNGFARDERYYNDIFRFTARHRAYKMHHQVCYFRCPNTFILGPVIRQTDGIGYEYSIFMNCLNQLEDLVPGTYIVVIKVNRGRHALALTLRRGRWVFFDPNFGSFLCEKGISEFIVFLNSRYPISNICVIKIIKKNRFPLDKRVLFRFFQNTPFNPTLQDVTYPQAPDTIAPVPAPRRNIAPVPALRRKLRDG